MRPVHLRTQPLSSGGFCLAPFSSGRYRIIRLLGWGGMGEVYQATDLLLGQPVALKFLPELSAENESARARFLNEVRTAREITHPNVCRVHDIGVLDGQLYISMEYVDGEDLASLLSRIGRLPTDKATELASALCAGLAAAHKRGVLHRDLKPSNLMLDGPGERSHHGFRTGCLSRLGSTGGGASRNPCLYGAGATCR
jgi:serine/threonine-protein kinase